MSDIQDASPQVWARSHPPRDAGPAGAEPHFVEQIASADEHRAAPGRFSGCLDRARPWVTRSDWRRLSETLGGRLSRHDWRDADRLARTLCTPDGHLNAAGRSFDRSERQDIAAQTSRHARELRRWRAGQVAVALTGSVLAVATQSLLVMAVAVVLVVMGQSPVKEHQGDMRRLDTRLLQHQMRLGAVQVWAALTPEERLRVKVGRRVELAAAALAVPLAAVVVDLVGVVRERADLRTAAQARF